MNYQTQALIDLLQNGMIDDAETVALIDQMTIAKIKEAVTEKIRPYQRSNRDIVYYDQNKKAYRIHIPKECRREGETPPTNCKKEHDLWLRAYEYLYNISTKPTVADCYNKWQTDRKDVSTYTVYCDTGRYNKYIRNHPIAKKQIHLVSPQDVRIFLDDVKQQNVTKSELLNIKSVLNCIFAYATEHDIIAINPTLQVRVKKDDAKHCKAVNNRNKVYTADDRQRILDYLAGLTRQTAYTLAIQLMFCLCCRIGELKALRWSDYDRERRTIYISRQVVTVFTDGKRRRQEKDHTKSGEDCDRVQPLSDRAIAVLHLAEALHPDHTADDLILPTTEGTPIYTNRFNQRLQQICKKAGVRYLSSHKIRFCTVTEQVKAGMDIDAIRYLAGHTRLATTLHYVRNVQYDQQAEQLRSVLN
ncbi:MAG: tyrosine-type recombinase/integrase [Lachnospiraceae bacterium]|nr:tyrosine-type recombinase/integrase [Lachnospiraceae bacterium]